MSSDKGRQFFVANRALFDVFLYLTEKQLSAVVLLAPREQLYILLELVSLEYI